MIFCRDATFHARDDEKVGFSQQGLSVVVLRPFTGYSVVSSRPLSSLLQGSHPVSKPLTDCVTALSAVQPLAVEDNLSVAPKRQSSALPWSQIIGLLTTPAAVVH